MEKKATKTASEILIERFLKDVEEKESMPWERPYQCYNAFNYFSMQPYRGFNRLILPFGEYMTANQINTYNKEHKEDFRFQKGIQWFPIYFYKKESKQCSYKEVSEALPDVDISAKSGYLGYAGGYGYFYNEDTNQYTKQRSILRYYEVADRQWFRNSKGELLPSRIESGQVEITKSEPQRVFNDYVDRSGITLQQDHIGKPCYIPSLDTVQLNPHTNSEESWFSTAFHEFAHSTGASNRLNRKGITHENLTDDDKKGKSLYATEECIAEITAYLCCAECGVNEFKTSETMGYDNHLAYVQSWKKRVTDFGKEFFYICSQADKAFNYIMGTTNI